MDPPKGGQPTVGIQDNRLASLGITELNKVTPRRRLDSEDGCMGVLNIRPTAERAVRWMNGEIRTTYFEILEVVTCPRFGSRWWSLERDVRSICYLSCGRPFLAVAMIVLFLGNVDIRVT